MLRVHVLANFKTEGIFRQTPAHSGRWGEVQFSIGAPAGAYDAVVVLNSPPEPLDVWCPDGNVWYLRQEPDFPGFLPTPRFKLRPFAPYGRVMTQKKPKWLPTARWHSTPPLVGWHHGLDYDSLVKAPVPAKSANCSWVTSTKTMLPGHQKRMALLATLRDRATPVEVFGRGIRPIATKQVALDPFRYTLAIENTRIPHYWTEKISDAFLARTVPLYCGCPNVTSYFKPASFIAIDLDDPRACAEQIEEIIQKPPSSAHLDAVEEARARVLNELQLFPWMAQKILTERSTGAPRRHRLDKIMLRFG